MAYNKTTFAKIHDIKGPDLIEDQILLTEEMGFKYRSAIGELLFAAIRCRPEIMYTVVKLSQFASQPAKIHCHAVKHVFKYLRDTIDYGIRYQRSEENKYNPSMPFPELPNNNHDMAEVKDVS